MFFQLEVVEQGKRCLVGPMSSSSTVGPMTHAVTVSKPLVTSLCHVAC